jgi:filamentous hemagglutinin
MEEKQAHFTASRIALGHAYDAHVLESDEFPEIRSREDFATLICEVLTSRHADERQLRRGRRAYWSEMHRVLVILDDQHEDGGTAFRPGGGKSLLSRDDIRRP